MNALKKGSKIGIMAPASKFPVEKINSGIKILEFWGLEIKMGKTVFGNSNEAFFADSDKNRLKELQEMLDDKNLEAILFARGGYGMIRIIDQLDFTKFINNPKWLIGYSDITILLNHINKKYNLKTIHGAMLSDFVIDEEISKSAKNLKNVLFGGKIKYIIPAHPLNQTGKAKAELIGGNLAIICSLLGSDSEINTYGKILFLEDVGEYFYRLDRMFYQLKRAKKLDNLAGLIIGGMTEMKNGTLDFGKNTYEIIKEITKEYNFPIAFDFPAGHVKNNHTIIFGQECEMLIDQNKFIFKQTIN